MQQFPVCYAHANVVSDRASDHMSDVEIFWIRNDLRLSDQPALTAAAEAGRQVVPVFLWSPDEEGDWPPGAARKWWLHHSLTAFAESLRERDTRLVVRRGPVEAALQKLIEETGASRVSFNAHFEPAVRERDRRVKKSLEAGGVAVKTFNASLLHHPEEVKTGSGGPYKVFTPFWKALQAKVTIEEPRPTASLLPFKKKLASLSIDELELLPSIQWDAGFYDAWSPGEKSAHGRLGAFLQNGLADYDEMRNRPDVDGTSRFSPYLHHGEISPRTIFHAVKNYVAKHPEAAEGGEKFLAEIGWREFGHHILYHFPHTPHQPLADKFQKMPWRSDKEQLRAWQRGQTGYPIVDAGMRQLWATGWMHNRVRMIVGSFLTKHMLHSWSDGADWFWDTLVDADLASNTLGWQWIGGCGADAAPYFRIFNPMTQGEKFDPNGNYIRTWVPEIAGLPDKYLNEPWEAPEEVRNKANVVLGKSYPKPLVDHGEARERALSALEQTK